MNIAEIRNTVPAAVKLIFTIGCCTHVEHLEGCESTTY